MSNAFDQLCATDKEIFDLLMSAKKRLTDAVFLELAKDRRIFCSHRSSRDQLADYLSTLQHDYNDLETIIERRDQQPRGEKSTFVEFAADITVEDLKSAISAYASEYHGIENVSIPVRGPQSLTAIFKYDEFDYSKNRLTQRQKKQAAIVASVEEGKTVLRLPATDKARRIVEGIRSKLDAARVSPVPTVELSVASLTTADDRTQFFTKLISQIPRHRLDTVNSLKVASFAVDADREEEDDDGFEEEVDGVESDLLAVVRSVALSGENLIATPQYRDLRQAGFFITSVVWRCVQLDEPGDMIQFDVSFDDPVGGTGVKYLVRHAARLSDGRYATTFKKLPDIRERNLFALIEKTARAVLTELQPTVTSNPTGEAAE